MSAGRSTLPPSSGIRKATGGSPSGIEFDITVLYGHWAGSSFLRRFTVSAGKGSNGALGPLSLLSGSHQTCSGSDSSSRQGSPNNSFSTFGEPMTKRGLGDCLQVT
jgi:hypothetical protein